MPSVSIVIPARNESGGLAALLPQLKALKGIDEIIVANDGSTDNTSEVCANSGIVELKHPYSKGNGAAVKSGVRAATGDVVVLMDGDGQHQAKDVTSLLAEYTAGGYDLVVGARSHDAQASVGRMAANRLYNRLATWMTGQKVKDLTSGFRVVNREKFLEFIHLLPNGFSYPTTSTMAFFRAGYSVAYCDIDVKNRIGSSHIHLVKDGIRFLIIIFKIGTLYSPLKVFFPVSLAFFLLGMVNYAYTYAGGQRFTNMSALLILASVMIFMMGLISEQITMLTYNNKSER